MTADETAPPFIIIGENIHCSRVVKREGARGGISSEGRPGIHFPGTYGEDVWIHLPESILESTEFTVSQRIKHVMAAVRVGLAGGPEAQVAADYVAWMAQRQIDGGAAYLDLNVDEIDHAVEGRLEAMVWLVKAVGPVSSVPLSIDSSDADVLQAGLDAIDPVWAGGAVPMVNSASEERTETLDMVKERGTPVVLSCTGDTMPSNGPERVERAKRIIAIAYDKGLEPDRLYVDPLIVPIGVDPEAGQYYLETVRFIRAEYGPQIHITGGVSNVSFGLPARRIISDVFLDLCVEAGHDSGIVDPVAADIPAALVPDRESASYKLAAAMLTGEDAFGMEFIEAYRAGKLS